MKQIITLLFSVLVLSISAQINIPNASFETWGTTGPPGWTTSVFYPLTQSSDAHTGTSAMKVTGSTNTQFAFHIPVSNAVPLHYTYWAKVHLLGIDDLTGDAKITYSQSVSAGYSVINFSGNVDSSKNSSIWRQVSADLLYDNSPNPSYDSVTLHFYISNSSSPNSYVIVDDLAFDFSTTGISPISHENFIESIYPTPAIHLASIVYTILEQADVSLDVYDLLGNKINSIVSESQANGRYRAEIDLGSYSNGVYLIKLSTMGRSHIQKLVVQH
jgi:hypothetical protein